MDERKEFDYQKYIQERLREIDDMDERRYAKEVLAEGLGKIFHWTEQKYTALENRVEEELYIPWNRYSVSTTVVEKDVYDPINSYWNPVAPQDTDKSVKSVYRTVYIAEPVRSMEQIREGRNASGERVFYRLQKAQKYTDAVRRLYVLFEQNHIPWRTLQMGYLERFYDLVPTEEGISMEGVAVEWREDLIPLWNIEKVETTANEYRVPCIDDVYYEHSFYVNDMEKEDGYLIDAEEEILAIRSEQGRITVKTRREKLESPQVFHIWQKEPVMSAGYGYPVFTNMRKESLAERYLYKTGNFIQTPMELCRKAEELLGEYGLRVERYEIAERAPKDGLAADMNELCIRQVFPEDARRILVFYILAAGKVTADMYSQVRYMLSQLQMEYMEYRCMGVVEGSKEESRVQV